MTRGVRNTVKPEQISLRLPAAMIKELDHLKDQEGSERTAVMVRALNYLISGEGNITSDAEYLNRLTQMETELADVRDSLAKITAQYEEEAVAKREIISELQKTINTLLRMLPKED
ncbi:MAG: hypothetical protein O0W99_04875 [Methanocorpusculum sp.]|nr:hypothetical protein [Methanocorpusculum sp.]